MQTKIFSDSFAAPCKFCLPPSPGAALLLLPPIFHSTFLIGFMLISWLSLATVEGGSCPHLPPSSYTNVRVCYRSTEWGICVLFGREREREREREIMALECLVAEFDESLRQNLPWNITSDVTVACCRPAGRAAADPGVQLYLRTPKSQHADKKTSPLADRQRTAGRALSPRAARPQIPQRHAIDNRATAAAEIRRRRQVRFARRFCLGVRQHPTEV